MNKLLLIIIFASSDINSFSFANTDRPTGEPTGNPSRPTAQPTDQPSGQPTLKPSARPTKPTGHPSTLPSGEPSGTPTSSPSGKPCSYCPSGTFYQNCSCIPCIPGYYCSGGCDSPVACSTGFFSSNFGGETLSSCLPCPKGFFSVTNATTKCEMCPAGHFCAEPDKGNFFSCYKPTLAFSLMDRLFSFMNEAPEACPIGSYAPVNSSECHLCPAGYSCSSASVGSNLVCRDGSYSLENWAACVSCPPGFSCPSISNIPVICPPGTYSSGGSTLCYVCPSGTYASTEGTDACTPCPPGYSCYNKSSDPVVIPTR